jgi:hypothetical protein
MKRTIVVLFVLLGIYVNSAFAQDPGIVLSDKPGWHKIGEVKASFKTETESIAVIGEDEFKSIKLKVTDAPINIDRITVYYESGEVEDVPVSNELQAGAETRVFDLKYPAKDLKKVTFVYKSLPSYRGDNAHVELYGLK